MLLYNYPSVWEKALLAPNATPASINKLTPPSIGHAGFKGSQSGSGRPCAIVEKDAPINIIRKKIKNKLFFLSHIILSLFYKVNN